MLTLDNLEPLQLQAVEFAKSRHVSLLVLPVGFGKTVVSLSAAVAVGFTRMLIVAPANVCKHTWGGEHHKWEHLQHLHVGVCCGSYKARCDALAAAPDVVVINPESLAWLAGRREKFDAVIVDELTRFKSAGAKSYKALTRLVKGTTWRVGMTATPVEEKLIDIFHQLKLLDEGAYLGTRKDTFLDEYFTDIGWNFENWEPKEGAAERIVERIRPITFFADRLTYTETLPQLDVYTTYVPMPKPIKAKIRHITEHYILPVGDTEIIAANGGVLQMKLIQLANGFIYDEEGEAIWIDDTKIKETVEDLAEHCDGTPLLIVFSFRAQAEKLKQLYPDVAFIDGTAQDKATIAAWNAGAINRLALHPKSAGHGLNLQRGGCRIALLSPIWSADLWHQVIGRLWRRGSPFKRVEVVVFVTEGSVEELMLERVDDKRQQAALFNEFLAGMTV